ncbi:MAG: hypothetical protein MJ201_01825 [Mycoplasmoidaceae bacterium]|nr:hypothetical protein [Mycoplasmoidaceae bacterium]
MVAGLVACNDPEGPTPDIPEDIHLTTTEARMNTELGAATFGVLLGEQPKDGKVLVTISKLPTSIDVRLVEP